MPIENIQQSFQTQMNQSAQAARSDAHASGIFMGHSVKVSVSPSSVLADAAEEMGFAVDKTKDFEISQRKEKDRSSLNQELLKQYQQWMHQAGKSQKMDSLVESMKSLTDRQSMLKGLSEHFSDASDAWAALEYALETLDKDPSVSDKTKQELAAARDEYFKSNAQNIRLGIQGAIASEGFGELDTGDNLKDLYRTSVGEFSDVAEVFSEIQTKYGTNFDRAMDFLFSAISADINSEVPSMGKEHLENVHSKLGLVRLAQSGYTLCQEVVSRWHDVHHGAGSLTSMGLLGDVLEMTKSSFPSSSQVDAICHKAEPADIEQKVLFIQEAFSAVRRFPDGLFPNNKRGAVMDAFQTSLDAAIEREDEYLASLD